MNRPRTRRWGAPQFFTAHVPSTFDPAVTRPEWSAYAHWVLSAVVVRRLSEKVSPDKFVPLSLKYCADHISTKVRRPLLNDLLRAGVLECDNLYYFGGRESGKCLCYRVGPAHREAKLMPVKLTHPELLKNLAREYRAERESVTDPLYCQLRDWHDTVLIARGAPVGTEPLLDRMIDGERRFSVCAQGRVHTNVANLPRRCRQYLRLLGADLVSVDVCSSQPLLLALDAIFMGLCSSSSHSLSLSPSLPSLWNCSDSPRSEFLDDCLTGQVYDRLADLSGYTRDEVKPKFLAVVYGRPEDADTKVGRAVRAAYPAEFAAAAELNARLGHGGLPRRLQRAESDLMVRRAAGRLMAERPRMPLLTVHDCVVVPKEDAEYAAAVVKEEWLAATGVAPRVKCSPFAAPPAA